MRFAATLKPALAAAALTCKSLKSSPLLERSKTYLAIAVNGVDRLVVAQYVPDELQDVIVI